MDLILRIDLRAGVCTPGDPESNFYEPAMALRWLDVARERGYRYQFFQSAESMSAFPCLTDRILNEGHCIDLLVSHSSSFWPASMGGHAFNGIASEHEITSGLPTWVQWMLSGEVSFVLRNVVAGKIQAPVEQSVDCMILAGDPSSQAVRLIDQRLNNGSKLITVRDASDAQG